MGVTAQVFEGPSGASELYFTYNSGACIPEFSVEVTTGTSTTAYAIFDPATTSCNGSGSAFELGQNPFSVFQFSGYTCGTTTHNCMQDVEYGFEVCNNGNDEEILGEITYTPMVTPPGVPGNPSSNLLTGTQEIVSGMCFIGPGVLVGGGVNRCQPPDPPGGSKSYAMKFEADATTNNGVTCKTASTFSFNAPAVS